MFPEQGHVVFKVFLADRRHKLQVHGTAVLACDHVQTAFRVSRRVLPLLHQTRKRFLANQTQALGRFRTPPQAGSTLAQESFKLWQARDCQLHFKMSAAWAGQLHEYG